jgi:hypothetical protein
MFKPTLILICFLVLSSCRETPKEVAVSKEQQIIEKIAEAHGFDNWKNVKTIHFTFNVDRDTVHFERSWIWHTATQEVSRITAQDTVTFNRSAVSDSLKPADSGFINDKFWLLFPYQLKWDKDLALSYTDTATAPISGKQLHKLTVVYPNQGGYTPGDAYDAYFGDDYLLQEWVYRKENQAEASLSTTWESYSDYKGLKIATTHKRADGNFTLYFTGISLETK